MQDSAPGEKQTFFREFRRRNVRKTLAIYLSAALTAVGISNVFSVRYQLPSGLFDVILVFIIFGFFNAGVYAWFRGGEEKKGGKKKEFLSHGAIVLVAGIVAFLFVTTPRSAALPRNAKTIAVLPFTIQSESKEDEYFGDGIMEDILTNLSRIGDLKVISRTSVMQYKEGYKEKSKSLRDIGRELNVGTILEGSVQRYANQVKISSRLINAETDENIWGEVYNREMENIFEIQSDVAQKIASALKATLSPDEKRLIDQKPTENLDAYAYYLRGRDLYYRYTDADNELAIEMFKNAIRIDHGYALAYAGLADAYGQRVQRFQYPHEWADSAMALSRKALALNPNIAEPHKSLGMAFATQDRYHEAIEQYKHAVRLNPNYSTAVTNLGLTYLWVGSPEKALPLIRRAITISPERYTNYSHLGTVFEALGVDSLAERYLRKSIEMQPAFIFPQIVLAEKMAYRGDSDGARRLIDSLLTLYPDDIGLLVTLGELEVAAGRLDKAEEHFRSVFDIVPVEEAPTTQLGFVLARKGKRREAESLLAKSIEVGMTGVAAGTENYDVPLDLARAYSALEDTAEALRWLRNAINLGWTTVSDIESEPMFRPIRGTVGFRTTLDSLKTSVAEKRRQLAEEGELY